MFLYIHLVFFWAPPQCLGKGLGRKLEDYLTGKREAERFFLQFFLFLDFFFFLIFKFNLNIYMIEKSKSKVKCGFHSVFKHSHDRT